MPKYNLAAHGLFPVDHDAPPDPMIRFLLGKFHVGHSRIGALRYVIGKLHGKRPAYRALPRDARRQLMRDVFQVHRDNFLLYVRVMRG